MISIRMGGLETLQVAAGTPTALSKSFLPITVVMSWWRMYGRAHNNMKLNLAQDLLSLKSKHVVLTVAYTTIGLRVETKNMTLLRKCRQGGRPNPQAGASTAVPSRTASSGGRSRGGKKSFHTGDSSVANV